MLELHRSGPSNRSQLTYCPVQRTHRIVRISAAGPPDVPPRLVRDNCVSRAEYRECGRAGHLLPDQELRSRYVAHDSLGDSTFRYTSQPLASIVKRVRLPD